jgi:hypothetical protein
MSKRLLLALLTLAFLFVAGTASAQGICPLNGTLNNKLVCLIPQVYGPVGLGSGTGAPLLADGHEAHFDNDFIAEFAPITEAVGIQVSQLPVASPSAGITFTYDPALKTFAPTTDESLGPILGERAGTIGRNKLYEAFSFQYFNFTSIDGQDMSKLPAIFQHQPFPPPFSSPFITSCANQTGLTGPLANNPCFVRDFIKTTNSIDLKVQQYTAYATYGVTNRLDLSVAVPFLNVQMKVTSNATIVPNSFAPPSPNFPGGVFHQFDPSVVPGCPPPGTPCLNGAFSDNGNASGIGDIVVRAKYELYKGERLGFAQGVDVRIPTGDPKNFLGSGAIGAKPFAVISYSARFSPHAEVGYEVNGKSVLAGNFVGATATNTEAALPNRFVYTVGADASINNHLTAAFDIVGERLLGAPRLISSPYTDLGHCSDINCDVLTPGTAHPNLGVATNVNYNETNASVGLKWRPVGRLVLSGNVFIKLDDGGLRSTVVPLGGISYSF